jgi:hypothetical protein
MKSCFFLCLLDGEEYVELLWLKSPILLLIPLSLFNNPPLRSFTSWTTRLCCETHTSSETNHPTNQPTKQTSTHARGPLPTLAGRVKPTQPFFL